MDTIVHGARAGVHRVFAGGDSADFLRKLKTRLRRAIVQPDFSATSAQAALSRRPEWLPNGKGNRSPGLGSTSEATFSIMPRESLKAESRRSSSDSAARCRHAEAADQFPEIAAEFALSEAEYAQRIAQIHEWIRAGDVYQLNFTAPMKFEAPRVRRRFTRGFAHASRSTTARSCTASRAVASSHSRRSCSSA